MHEGPGQHGVRRPGLPRAAGQRTSSATGLSIPFTTTRRVERGSVRVGDVLTETRPLG
jgi:hypothetical protein